MITPVTLGRGCDGVPWLASARAVDTLPDARVRLGTAVPVRSLIDREAQHAHPATQMARGRIWLGGPESERVHLSRRARHCSVRRARTADDLVHVSARVAPRRRG